MQWEYPLNSLLHGMRALVVAAETYLRINDEGIMCIQHQVEVQTRTAPLPEERERERATRALVSRRVDSLFLQRARDGLVLLD